MGERDGKVEMKRRKERIGFDFDNTLTKLPFPFTFLNRVFNSTQTPKFLYMPYWKIVIRMPIFLNRRKLRVLEKWAHEFDIYIVTGRWNSEWTIAKLLAGYGFCKIFKGIYAPHPPPRVSTQLFKEDYCKRLKLDWYFEDNYYTIYYLRKKGIKAVRV